MTTPAYPNVPSEPGRKVDARQLWAGGLATALVAALIALVGILVSRWLFSIPILAPSSQGAWGNAHTGDYVLAAVLVALIATGLMHLLLLATPQPSLFFGWIIALATLAAVVYPFSTNAPVSQKAATAVVNLVLGIAIGSLTSRVAARSVRRRPPSQLPGPPPGGPGYQPPRYPESRTPGSQGF
jgi:Family of unknown function (DUF6069)